MISYKVVQTVYCIQLSIPEFQKIMDYDSNAHEGNGNTLYEQLIHLEGVDEVEYDGHFGANIWVTLDKEHDTGRTWNKIERMIDKVTE